MSPAASGQKTGAERPSAEAFLSRFPYEYPALLLAVAMAMLGLLEFGQDQKWLILICCLLSAVICGFALFNGKLQKKGREVILLSYGLYLLWLSLGVLWACSGKLFLREFSKQLFALPLVLFIFLLLPRKESAVRKLLFFLSAVGAVYAFFSIDVASAGLTKGLLYLIPNFKYAITGFESGTRLTGVFRNGNISAGLLAICIFLSLYLMESAENRRERIFATVFIALQANTFLLNFSMGATAFFMLSVIVYLIFAGKQRAGALLRMLEIAIPTVITVFLSFRFFEALDGRAALPVFAAILNAIVIVLLELKVYLKMLQAFDKRKKAVTVLFIAVLLLIGVYAAAGLILRGDLELPNKGEIRRSCYPTGGEYSVNIDADGDFRLRIISQNEQEAIMHTETVLYSGTESTASFTVPEDSRVVYLYFSSKKGATLHSVTLTGPETISIHLDYPLLPGFIANRLQGFKANENAIQRAAFFRDGMKVFRDRPILGGGLGSFETLLFGYQNFYYETKYVHNHYIQVMLDSGIIGIILYLCLLVLMAVSLWVWRKKEGPFRRLYPALCAAFVMIASHTCMEVVLSIVVYIPYACAVMALIAVCFPLHPLKKSAGTAAKLLPGIIAVVYAILIFMNLRADAEVKNSTDSATRFFESLEYAAKVDAFEKNDWMVSYLNTCADLSYSNPDIKKSSYKAKSDRYADMLIDTPSNSLHQYLISYYLTFQEYDNALIAAKKSVYFNYSDSINWNDCFNCFVDALADHPQDRQEILRCVREMNDELEKYQQQLMETIQLDETSAEIIADALNE